jgi:hypothetical protein
LADVGPPFTDYAERRVTFLVKAIWLYCEDQDGIAGTFLL